MKQIKNLALILIYSCAYWSNAASAQSIYGLKYLVEYSIEKCGKDYPLMVTIKNHTMKNMKSVVFKIIATNHGYSTELYNQDYRTDKIIKRFSTEIQCFAVKNAPLYPGREDQRGIDKNLSTFEINRKYGYDIGSIIIGYRATQSNSSSIYLDPGISIKDLNLSAKSEWESFD